MLPLNISVVSANRRTSRGFARRRFYDWSDEFGPLTPMIVQLDVPAARHVSRLRGVSGTMRLAHRVSHRIGLNVVA
jgi:hypothetical protein